ncbi:hypothetical protein [Aliivibrio fischeri]|uniref:hypothetical protein n=1 Tax=Aliivibrio fischeri TaxID=668 RepID=UPI00080E3699|nr:hypothetical protein [Aliivibrio fischeri]OCH11875.1 hypothetical protein A6E09_18910 [Aliivibrio fischeri]
MKKIRYPFDLKGQISINFKDHVKPTFIDTCNDNTADIPINEFVVKSFNYDSESRLLSISLQKAINATSDSNHDELINGTELANNIIKLDLIYCLYNAAIISSHISYPLDSGSFIKTLSVSRPLTLHLN